MEAAARGANPPLASTPTQFSFGHPAHSSGRRHGNNFGLTPKGAPSEELHKLVTLVLTDGLVPGSLKFDWESIEGATYEVQWASAPTFATLVGSATSASASDYTISGLVPGTQYWTRVRPLRGAQSAEWSDPATRVAPV